MQKFFDLSKDQLNDSKILEQIVKFCKLRKISGSLKEKLFVILLCHPQESCKLKRSALKKLNFHSKRLPRDPILNFIYRSKERSRIFSQ